jgi:hypothetical protein
MKFLRSAQTDFTAGAAGVMRPSFLTAFAERPTLDQFLLLSLLLHVLAVLLFGDTSGAANKLGQRLWGASSFNFNATLNQDRAKPLVRPRARARMRARIRQRMNRLLSAAPPLRVLPSQKRMRPIR